MELNSILQLMAARSELRRETLPPTVSKLDNKPKVIHHRLDLSMAVLLSLTSLMALSLKLSSTLSPLKTMVISTFTAL